MSGLGEPARVEARVYFTGGASAVLIGWRKTTIDVDIEVHPSAAEDAVAAVIPRLKDSLQINVEFPSPSHFLPELPGWEERSPFIGRYGSLSFHHYHFHAQALAKAVRDIGEDAADVEAMRDRGLMTDGAVCELFALIEPQLYRYPSLDAGTVRRRVTEVFGPPK